MADIYSILQIFAAVHLSQSLKIALAYTLRQLQAGESALDNHDAAIQQSLKHTPYGARSPGAGSCMASCSLLSLL